MTGFLLVAVGGAVGASTRYAVSQCTHAASDAFPWSTLGINVAGSFLLGLLTAVLPEGAAGERLRLLVGVGALGGFTTFSTFSVEALALARGDQWLPAVGYVVGSVASGSPRQPPDTRRDGALVEASAPGASTGHRDRAVLVTITSCQYRAMAS